MPCRCCAATVFHQNRLKEGAKSERLIGACAAGIRFHCAPVPLRARHGVFLRGCAPLPPCNPLCTFARPSAITLYAASALRGSTFSPARVPSMVQPVPLLSRCCLSTQSLIPSRFFGLILVSGDSNSDVGMGAVLFDILLRVRARRLGEFCTSSLCTPLELLAEPATSFCLYCLWHLLPID